MAKNNSDNSHSKSVGSSEKEDREKRKKIFQKLNFSAITKDFVYNVCIQEATMMKLKLSKE